MYQEVFLIRGYSVIHGDAKRATFRAQNVRLRPYLTNTCRAESGSPDKGGDDVDLANINGDCPDFMAGYGLDL